MQGHQQTQQKPPLRVDHAVVSLPWGGFNGDILLAAGMAWQNYLPPPPTDQNYLPPPPMTHTEILWAVNYSLHVVSSSSQSVEGE